MSRNEAPRSLPAVHQWITIAAIARAPRHGLICVSTPMRNLAIAIEHLAPRPCAVLIQGESGTGKEAVAAALHALGPGRYAPLVKFRCANLASDRRESQLFARAFNRPLDLCEDPAGHLQAAGGSLLLDEVGELPLALQAKLLRVV